MREALTAAAAAVTETVGDRADGWDRAGLLPEPVIRDLAAAGHLAAQIPAAHGGPGWSSADNGEFTAHVGSLCGSLRSVMTSQGMAAWTVERFGDPQQAAALLPRLAAGTTAAVAFSEPQAGSDLSAIAATVTVDGDSLLLSGDKKWVTAAAYADLLLVVARMDEDAAVVVVDRDAPGVRLRPVADPLGCRAAGHADVRFDAVRLPLGSLLGGGRQPLPLLVATALAYGRLSVAWGCTGILRACVTASTAHARSREQFGRPLGQHQLVARHLAELWSAEQVATRVCAHASRCWDENDTELGTALVLAKYVSAEHAAKGAAAAVQVLASAGAQDGHVVARAYRDAKLMEIIEGSTEVCQLILAEHALGRL
ncbi:acyl-CoA dehydrogenase family protein [Streptomyces tsukubensis]|uniref:Acyl-CoA dehydrogenase n=1 Tax=Streptomyces tsukubensis TaxID=83656 RepID=A0A1V4AAN8_9ACTN|nr:acyl-CoA dehydrogenase family protein [Streptomyces tsukubensis]OON80143.1 acyl-CoA dehydrogenase [Streptomyces tsukubensis]QFR97372.1 acyl-CoA dehydrogenase [Streptomyces tsukubensis]